MRSAIVSLAYRRDTVVPAGERDALRRLVKYAFANRRKKINTILRKGPLSHEGLDLKELLTGCDIDPDVRPQQISVTSWLALARAWPRDGS